MNSFFKTLLKQFENNLPFVSYRKPNNTLVKGFMQSDSKINYVKDFSESGFVFAPFDDSNKTILLPFENPLEYVFDEEFINCSELVTRNNPLEKHNHIDLVEKGLNDIEKQTFTKVVLSRKEFLSSNKSPITLYKNALSLYKNAFVYIWFHPKVGCWIGATPEVFLETRNNQFRTMSLAGTKIFKENIKWEAKEKDEQQIVTDYISTNLTKNKFDFRVGVPNTVRAGNLAHIRTDITGVLNSNENNNNLGELINTLHPTPAVCGFPRNKAKTFILSNENYDREYYTGFLGELNFNLTRKNNRRNTENMAYRFISKTSSLYVNLRCLKYSNKGVFVFVGGGITINSSPIKEYNETCDKLNTMKNIL
jgi:isochorismate synthase